jgi:hypothetical protein
MWARYHNRADARRSESQRLAQALSTGHDCLLQKQCGVRAMFALPNQHITGDVAGIPQSGMQRGHSGTASTRKLRSRIVARNTRIRERGNAPALWKQCNFAVKPVCFHIGTALALKKASAAADTASADACRRPSGSRHEWLALQAILWDPNRGGSGNDPVCA